ncbi:MAG: hypothetical protein AEth_01893 [Candidatus Argoarchaeum ethanivorans]|uniref:DUF4062 domain-containing protein n=1 Tax=Candidatus Argoarchaeum ethanivorans TaxID=2608793 RepID=A0A8B3RZA8_9EURY|nr:MAG: hypothetical protein AEth_01893 [Candidatus Argoarchaeum ethanivorans]
MKLMVFISARIEELKEEREKVREGISELWNQEDILFKVWDWENAKEIPSGKNPDRIQSEGIENSDIYILILGSEYGDFKYGESPTHKEYKDARSKIEEDCVLIYIKEVKDRKEKVDRWIKEIKENEHTYKIFKNPDDFKNKIKNRLRDLWKKRENSSVILSSVVTPIPTHKVGTQFGERIVLGENRYERAFTIEDVKVVTFTRGIVDECDVFGQHYTVRMFKEGKGGVDEFTVAFIEVHFEGIGYATEMSWKRDRIQFTVEDIYGDSIGIGYNEGSWVDFATASCFEEAYPIYVYDDDFNWKGMCPHVVISLGYKPDIWRALTLEYIPCDEDRTIPIKLIE